MIKVIAEHSVDTDILRKEGNILDLGARGFQFCEYFDKRGHYVVPVDCDDLGKGRPYLRFAVTNYNGVAYIKRTHDPQATGISKLITGESVEAITLQKLMVVTKIPYFDLIKMDVEGSEYEIIMSLEEAPAKQISCEYHLHTGVYGQSQMRLMEIRLKNLGYKAVSHDLTNQHSAGLNYWDSLFILK